MELRVSAGELPVRRAFVPDTNLLQGSPIAALLLAAYGGQSAGLQAYRPAMYYASSLSIGAAGLVALVRLRMSTKMLKKL